MNCSNQRSLLITVSGSFIYATATPIPTYVVSETDSPYFTLLTSNHNCIILFGLTKCGHVGYILHGRGTFERVKSSFQACNHGRLQCRSKLLKAVEHNVFKAFKGRRTHCVFCGDHCYVKEPLFCEFDLIESLFTVAYPHSSVNLDGKLSYTAFILGTTGYDCRYYYKIVHKFMDS